MTNQPVYVVKDNCCGGCGNVHAVFSTRPAYSSKSTTSTRRLTTWLLVDQ